MQFTSERAMTNELETIVFNQFLIEWRFRDIYIYDKCWNSRIDWKFNISIRHAVYSMQIPITHRHWYFIRIYIYIVCLHDLSFDDPNETLKIQYLMLRLHNYFQMHSSVWLCLASNFGSKLVLDFVWFLQRDAFALNHWLHLLNFLWIRQQEDQIHL